MSKKSTPRNTYKYEALMRYAKILGFGDLHIKIDAETGLHAIIAIHNTQLGPAIGGTRLYKYSSTGPAMLDAMRLSYMMTLKAAVNRLPHGGGKAVLLMPRAIKDRNAYFRTYGDFVHELNGRYITAMDVGTTTEDMDVIAERTPYVIGATRTHKYEGDPSPYTALGVLRGIEAAVQFKLNRDDLNNTPVAIQGAGHVGAALCRLLSERGAKITICDKQTEAAELCASRWNATVVPPDEIYGVECDVFAPSAMGGVINFDTLSQLKAAIVAGSANNQLAHHKYGRILHQNGILYAPDFVINSGGLIQAAMTYDYQDEAIAIEKINNLYDTMLMLFERSARHDMPTDKIAEMIAKENIKTGVGHPIVTV